jgi:hypothetical protein
MKLSELKEQIDRIVEYAPRDADSEVMVAIKLPHTTVGATPMMEITSIMQGFDWEKGKIILRTKEPLMPFDKDIGDKLRTVTDKMNHVRYQNKQLEEEIDRLKKQFAETKELK